MSNYAIIDIETDTICGTYSMLATAKIVRDALTDFYDNQTRFSIIRFEYITMRAEDLE